MVVISNAYDSRLEERNRTMLEIILDEKVGQVEWYFDKMVDDLKHEGRNLELVRVVDMSDYRNPMPKGKSGRICIG